MQQQDAAASSSRVFLPSVRVETFDGMVHHLRRRQKTRKTVVDDMANVPRNAQGSICLLDTPIHRLKQQIKDDEQASAAAAAAHASGSEARERKASAKGKEAETWDMKMWVDKYRPDKFTDLLGDERVNRETMAWLKQWDECVFKRHLGAGSKKRMRAEAAAALQEGGAAPADPLGRPRERVLLMSGPPGLGKTTLANIVAAQAGYNILEINASDDRSAGTVTNRIKNALDAGSALGSKKPTLVVIDEIDGATGGGDQSFIKSLLKLIQDTPARKRGANDKAEPARFLKRPIICICNDLYAPSLRQLRPFARMVRFNKPPPAVLVKRLKAVCAEEGLTADSRSLNKLAEVTGCDIRSCLNTLQFVKSRSAVLTEAMVKMATVGLKDSGTSTQMVWNSLFVPVSAKKQKVGLGMEEGKYVNRMVQTVSSCGEYDKVMQGAFEHYPNLKWQDNDFVRVNAMHDWIHFYDVFDRQISANQTYELMGYLPYAFAPWFVHFANHSNATRPTEFPKQDYEAFLQRSTNEEVINSLALAIPPVLRSLYGSTSISTELAPLLMRILSPNLKPINAQIIKPDERQTLSRLVQVMITHKLRFFQERGEDGKLSFRLDPPIDVFVHYDGKRASDIASSRYAVRSLVTTEIEAELLRRHQAAYPEAKETASLFRRSKKDEEVVDKIALDFFGRPIVLPSDEADAAAAAAAAPPRKKFRVVYKFHEGSSTAVRKPLKMAALF